MEASENRGNPQQTPEINQEKAAEENTGNPPQLNSDCNVEEVFEVILVKAEDGRSSIRIPEMEAICEICYALIPEEAIVFKRRCKCKLTKLTHQKCYVENTLNTKCDVCDQNVQYVQAKLSRPKVQPIELQSPSRSKRHMLSNLLGGGPSV